MARRVEIATYVLAGGIALGGGYIGAELLLDRDTPAARAASERPPPERSTASAPVEGVELRNARYGFSFRHPEGWRTADLPHPHVVATVMRPDGVMCMVSVNELALQADATGRPEHLSRMLAGLSPSHIMPTLPAAGAKVSNFETSTLGGQEARSFVVEASVPPLGTLKVSGHATLRGFGAIVLMCMAPDRLLRTAEVKTAFELVHTSFRFE